MRASSIVMISGIVAAITQAIGLVLWLPSADVTLERFDLSSLQSPEHNPTGYLIPWAGTLVSMLLLLSVGRMLQAVIPVAARVLTASMILFVGNSLYSFVWPEQWEIHALLARVSFITLIVAQIQAVRAHGETWERATAYACMLAAIGLFVLPKYIGIDAVFLTTNVQSSLILGIAEILYVVIIYATLYRVTQKIEGLLQ